MRFCPPPNAAAARRRSISVVLAAWWYSTKFEGSALAIRGCKFKVEFAKLQSPFLQIRLPPVVQTRLYAGRQLRQLRAARARRQADFATQLGISASYLSQIEHDDRPLTPALLGRLQRLFPLEWEEVAADAGARRAGALREAAADRKSTRLNSSH